MANQQPTLENLFSDTNRLRIIKYFIRNADDFSSSEKISKILNIRKNIIEKESKKLLDYNFLKSKKIGRINSYSLNDKFYLYPEIKNLINSAMPVSDGCLISKLQSTGKIKIALVAGVFINSDNSRADMLIVGRTNPRKLNTFVKFIESQICRELNFVVMTPEEFKYRHRMFDRFIHDMLELPNKKLICKIKI